jgi:hypothetical protein
LGGREIFFSIDWVREISLLFASMAPKLTAENFVTILANGRAVLKKAGSLRWQFMAASASASCRF